MICYCLQYFTFFFFFKEILIAAISYNVAAGEHCSCECSFMVFGAWQTRVSSYCPLRKCGENRFPGWSDSLIHCALLDLRLTVQLLPINMKTHNNKKEEEEVGGVQTGRRRPMSFLLLAQNLSQDEPALHIKVGHRKLLKTL